MMSSLVPKLRFKEFSGEWEEKKLGSIYEFFPTNSFSRDKLNYASGLTKNIHYGDIHTKFPVLFDITKEKVPYINQSVDIERIKKKYYCIEGDIIFADASEDLDGIGKVIEIMNLNNENLVAGLHTLQARQKEKELIKGFSGYLLKSNFIRNQIMRESQGTKVLGISVRRLENITIFFPKRTQEQQKIANCLNSLDSLIESQNKKVETLKKHKKGLMQQLFPLTNEKEPKLRFKEFSGRWIKKDFEKIFNRIPSKQFQINSIDYLNEGTYPIVDQGKQNIIAFSNNNSKVIKNNRGLIVFGDHTRIIKYIDFDFVVGADGTQLLNVKKEFDIKFFYYVLLNKLIPNMGYNRHFKFLKEIDFKVPCEQNKQEQQKIANCLSSLDSLIESQNKKIKALKNHKKGLMQQMFINSEISA